MNDDAETTGMKTTVILMITCGAVGGLLLCGCLCGCLWYNCTEDEDDETTVLPAEVDVEEKTHRSEGGYRTKRTQVVKERLPKRVIKKRRRRGCCIRILRSCFGCCIPAREEMSAPAPAPIAAPKIAVGSAVQIHGLAAAPHLNGLTGTVASGPNDKGRYLVSLVMETGGAQSEQSKSFLPQNLHPLGYAGNASMA